MATRRINIAARLNFNLPRPVKGRELGSGDPERSVTPAPVRDKSGIFDIARNYGVDHRSVPTGTALFAENETSNSLYVVLDGWLMSYRILEDGGRQILDFALPGAVLGYRACENIPFAYSSEAVTDAEIAIIPLSRVRTLLGNGGQCAVALLEGLNDVLLDTFDTLTDVGRRTAREAVSHFLIRMERRIRRVSGSGLNGSVPFPLIQEQIGDALGLTSVHVCRTLSKLRDDGLIEIGGGQLHILDAEALAFNAGIYDFDEGIGSLVH